MAMTVGECYEYGRRRRANGVQLTVGSERVNPRYRFIHDACCRSSVASAKAWLADFYFATPRTTPAAPGGARGTRRRRDPRQPGDLHLGPDGRLAGRVEIAYGYWTNLLHRRSRSRTWPTGCPLPQRRTRQAARDELLHWPRGSGAEAGLRIVGENGMIFGTSRGSKRWSLAQRCAAARRASGDFQRVLLRSTTAAYPDDPDGRLFAAIREQRAPLVTGESRWKRSRSSRHPLAWLRHGGAFRAGPRRSTCPPRPRRQSTDGRGRQAQGWDGGRLVAELRRIIQSPEPWLECRS